MKKVILLVIGLMLFSGCVKPKPTLTEMETENFICVVYDNDLDNEVMDCKEKPKG